MAEPLQPKNKTAALDQLVSRAMDAHRRGGLAEAEALYSQVLQAQHDHFEARHLLGVLRGQQARYDEALELVGAALKSRPDSVGALSNHGLILRKMGRHQEALASFEKALAMRPDDVEALSNRGNVLSELGLHAEALASYDRALAIRPNYAEALNNRGIALTALGRHEDALASFARALANRPDYAEALHNRGNALSALGRRDEALASFDRALLIRPDYADAHCSRANLLAELKRHEQALASYERALAIRAGDADALYNYGNILSELKRYDEALAAYDSALAIEPDYVRALENRGNVLSKIKRYDEALASYEAALAIDPRSTRALTNRGAALKNLGAFDEALACYDRALAIEPDNAELRLAKCMAHLPALYMNEEEIELRRAAYRECLTALCEEVARERAPIGLAGAIGSSQPFYLPYQGLNDRDLQSLYGGLVCRVMEQHYPAVELAPAPRLDEPVRIGVVSGFFRNHSNWKIPIKGWLSQLDRRQFRVFGYHTGTKQDSATEMAAGLCERFVQGPLPLGSWRQAILDDAPHVLVYPEVGMDRMSARLSAQRLARTQCTSWGHPDTSGFPTLDYYLSSDLMEPPDAQDHYSERLIRLPNLSIYYEPVDLPPASLARSDLGLRPTARVYWCGQSLYKYLPQYDHVFPHIAREVGDCQFAFIQHQSGAGVTDLFRKRLARVFATHGLSAADHCVFLRRLNLPEFIAAAGLCDIVLDSIGWSGCNSTLEGLTHALPVVTLPASFMRGRHSMAILEMMGVTQTIAATLDDYVAIAVRLARDEAWRRTVMSDIAARKHSIYRDRSCVEALEAFFNRVGRDEGAG